MIIPHHRTKNGFLWVCHALLFAALIQHVSAQWKTEAVPLKTGWNAVYMNVDTTHTTLNQMIGLDSANPIQEIWMWVPPAPGTRVTETPESPTAGSTGWRRWDRFLAGSSELQKLPSNSAVLVRVAGNVSSYTWNIVGKPVPPLQGWTGSGLNLIGLSTPAGSPPLWSDFLGPSRELQSNAEIFRYNGGAFSATNPQQIFPSLFRSTRVMRNQAYWIRAEEFNRYFGPFQIELSNHRGITFGSALNQYILRIRNVTDAAIQVDAALINSLAAPTGQTPVAGTPAVIVRGERNLEDLSYAFAPLAATPTRWNLAPQGEPGSRLEIVLGLDRALMGGTAGDQFAATLRLTDSRNHTQVDLPLTAETASTTGLWIGNAMITDVAQALTDYTFSSTGALVTDEQGSYVPAAIDDSMQPVTRGFPLRLLVHQPQAGSAALLQQVFIGPAPDGESVLARTQNALDPARSDEARRVSVAHLPLLEGNAGWSFDGALARGSTITTEILVPQDNHASSPFLHTYHPDHDNRDDATGQPLPRGNESYDIVRQISLTVETPQRADFASVIEASSILAGVFEETILIRGLANTEKPFRTRGIFSLNRVIDIPIIQD